MKTGRGFTLLEILIALTILLLMLSLATNSMKTARMNSEQAANHLQLATFLPLFTERIQQTIRSAPSEAMSGSGELQGVQFQWRANVVQKRSPASQFNPEAMTETKFNERFLLYEVQLTLTKQGKSRTFKYLELAWLPVKFIVS